MERQKADGGISSLIENDREEDYYYTAPISQQLNQVENLKSRSLGGVRSQSSSPSTTKVPPNLQNRVKESQPKNSR